MLFIALTEKIEAKGLRKIIRVYKLGVFSLASLALCFSVYGGNINVTVITDKNCVFCATMPTEDYLKNIFPGIVFKSVDYKKRKSEKLIKEYKINSLPAFILPGNIKKESSFSRISKYVEKKKNAFILNKKLSGEFMLLGRKEIPSRIDVFFSLYDHNLTNVLETLRKFCTDENIKLAFHILNIRGDKNTLLAQREEEERLLAVEEVYPDKFWGYFTKRLKNINSTLWIDDMESVGISYDKIKDLIHSKKIKEMIKDSDTLARKLGITNGIAMLINNKRIFKVYNIKRSELKKIVEMR